MCRTIEKHRGTASLGLSDRTDFAPSSRYADLSDSAGTDVLLANARTPTKEELSTLTKTLRRLESTNVAQAAKVAEETAAAYTKGGRGGVNSGR